MASSVMSSPRPVEDTYESWTVPPRQSSSRTSMCGRFLVSWTFVSIVEILLITTTVVIYFFFPKMFLDRMLPKDRKDHKVDELAEWLLRLFASMIVVQLVELIAGIGWGEPNARKIIYWGMLGGDVMLVAIYAAFVHSMSEWHAVNITIVTLASAFGFLRIITLVLKPRWWNWGSVAAQPELM